VTMDNTIDWNGKLEAVHENGKVVSITDIRQDDDGDWFTHQLRDGQFTCFGPNDCGGWHAPGTKWTIRNVAEAKAVEAPETHRQGTNGVRTGVEALERLEALELLVRRMAVDDIGVHEAFAEARALAPEPVDPDLVEAREACAIHAQRLNDYGLAAEYRSGELDQQFEMQATLAAIKRGRALERGEG